MNPEDNIKNFFQKRLKQDAPETADWNIPSDDIWEKAKVQFPKENKSRKLFLFLCLGLVGLVLAGFIGYAQLGNNSNHQLREQSLSKEEKNILAAVDQADVSTQNSESITNNPIASLSKNPELIGSNNDEKNNSSNNSADVEFSRKVNSKNNITDQNITETQSKSNVINKAKSSSNSESYNFKKSESNATQGSITNSESTIAIPSLSNIDSNSTVTESLLGENSLTDGKDLIQLSKLSKKSIDLLDHNRIDSFNTDQIITPLKKSKKWEIGVSTSPLVFPIAKLIEEDSEGTELIDIDLKYLGLNIPVTRILNHKWSITSGLYYKRGSISAKFIEEETFDIGDNNISMMFDDKFGDASITLEDKTQEILVELKPNEEILDGDMIIAQGSGKFEFNLFQVPLLANYHINKNRFEFIFSLGPALELARVTISEFDAALSKQNRIITEPISFTPMSHNYLEYGVYAGVGTKYHFNETTNLSYTLRTDLTAIILTTHEIGLHYRF